MSDKYVEKSFLYLFVVSLLLHVGVIAALLYLPSKTPPPKEPIFVDLQQIPEALLSHGPTQHEARRHSDRRMRVQRETAPRGYDTRDSGARPSRRSARPFPSQAQSGGRPSGSGPSARQEGRVPEGSSVAGLLKPRSQTGRPSGQSSGRARLFPGAAGLARLEESYRRKFEKDVAEGSTKFLNTDDIRFGSFLRHFENSVYGVWRYPEEAARNGIQGVTPVKITFNRRGEIVHVELLESSGARILDEEVFRTLKLIGPVGNLPRGYDKEEFNLIAFFQYGMARKFIR